MFADYRVPQALEHFGVLEYSDDLKEKLKLRVPLQPGHRWAIHEGVIAENVQEEDLISSAQWSCEENAWLSSLHSLPMLSQSSLPSLKIEDTLLHSHNAVLAVT